MLQDIAIDAEPRTRVLLLERLTKLGVTMLTGVRASEITENGLGVVDQDGKKQVLEADTVVFAVGSKSCRELAENLEGKVPELYVAGDCARPRKIFEAIHEGSSIARMI